MVDLIQLRGGETQWELLQEVGVVADKNPHPVLAAWRPDSLSRRRERVCRCGQRRPFILGSCVVCVIEEAECMVNGTTGWMYSGILENTVLLIAFIIDLAHRELRTDKAVSSFQT